MIVISKSKIDTRTLSMALIGISGTPLLLGLWGFNLGLIISGIVLLTAGLLLLFYGKSTYSISYDQKSQQFTLNSRQDNLTIEKGNVLSTKRHFTFFQILWPFPRPYYYALTAKNKLAEEKRYKFVIWSNQKQLKSNYQILKRSVATWTKGK